MNIRNDQRGFTLTELLVATAIFALLMSAIAALFVSSLHAVRAGYQSQEAFETARGTFSVIERDLTTVYTSRDFGQYYQFYGNEYGMTMVGLIRSRDSQGREFSRIGRITYVIYPVVISRWDAVNNVHEFFVTEPFAYEYARRMGITDIGLSVDGLYKTRGVRFSSDNLHNDDTAFEICVAALVRYVEPGVSDLDTFPFDWEDIIAEYEANPEYPPAGSGLTIREQLDESLEFNTAVSASPSSDPEVLARLNNAREQMFAAKKRDLWIRMLSCQEFWIPQLNTGLAVLPNVWGRLDPNDKSVVVDPIWLRDMSTVADDYVSPRDFVVVETIGVNTPPGTFGFPLRPFREQPPLMPFFEYGRVNADTVPDLMPMWGANRFAYLSVPDGYDNDGDGLIDENDEIFTVDGIDNDGDGLIDEPDERVVAPRIDQVDPTQLINLVGIDGLDNDYDGIIDEAGETVETNLAFGSPLIPRIPEVVKVRLPMVYPPAHANAPVFKRNLEQLIDVPTAYTRSRLAYEGP